MLRFHFFADMVFLTGTFNCFVYSLALYNMIKGSVTKKMRVVCITNMCPVTIDHLKFKLLFNKRLPSKFSRLCEIMHSIPDSLSGGSIPLKLEYT